MHRIARISCLGNAPLYRLRVRVRQSDPDGNAYAPNIEKPADATILGCLEHARTLCEALREPLCQRFEVSLEARRLPTGCSDLIHLRNYFLPHSGHRR